MSVPTHCSPFAQVLGPLDTLLKPMTQMHHLVGLNQIKVSLVPKHQISKKSISLITFLHLPPLVQELQGLAQAQNGQSLPRSFVGKG